MKSSYGGFASLYDALTYDVDYEKMADCIEWLFQKNALTPELVLDLACGTGSLTLALSGRGYDMLGADASADMLSVAGQKKGAEKILFLNQPMEDFELYGTVDAITCALDSINYLTEPDALEKTFRLCANYLNPDGLFIFDVNSEYKFSQILGQEIYTHETDDIFYVWENDFDPQTRLCNMYLTFFAEKEEGLYHRVDELHTQRAYTDDELKKALSDAGFMLTGRYDDYTRKAPGEATERIVYVAKKNQ
ncbi:MAG: class I SAM-dependent methyltransferase [Ruminococcaceae bacterium]|nr:class I SAM-dependent methyltransferase [Oscillospiraceae bacterium]